MAQKEKKRGRPFKQKIFSAAELRQQAEKFRKQSQERIGSINYEQVEEGLELMLNEEKLKECTKAELKELRRMAERLWDRFQIEKEYEADQAWEGGYGVCREPVEGMMSEDEWSKQHEFLKPKRKNAKQTHSIYSLPEHKKAERGLATEPVRMEFDIEATEKQIEEALMAEAMARHQQEEQFFTKGRRLSGRNRIDPNAPARKSHWI